MDKISAGIGQGWKIMKH